MIAVALIGLAVTIVGVALWYGPAVREPDENALPEALPYIVDERPTLLRYDELTALSDRPREAPDDALRDRLDTLLTTPFVNNEAYYRGVRPHRPIEPGLGPTLRVVSWNIERGLRLEAIRDVLSGGDSFLRHLDADDDDLELTPELRREVVREAEMLSTADVLVLQEVDWGMKRTGYRAVVEELARAADMNWAYGVEFLEVDPFNLGTEEFAEADEEDRDEMLERTAVDAARYKGMHGTAVLSRYPIASARLVPLERQGHDWFAGEVDGTPLLEQAKREAAEEVFRTPIGREIRRGGRTVLIVDLDVPAVAEGVVTVVAAHYESRAEPEARREQLIETFEHIRGVANPVILAGDMNTSGEDGKPTSWKREVYRRVGNVEFWGRTAAKYLSGIGIAFDAAVAGIGMARKTNDPTVEDIPVLSPNEEGEFFDTLEGFRFDDGGAFDFRGTVDRSLNGNEGTLANSNHRDTKGFVVTYQVERTLGPAGKMKLDWIFVKAYARDPRDPTGSFVFAPHRGRTMERLNYAVADRISDHSPISVELPLPGGGS